MADINQLIPLLFRWEGGYVNDPVDLGGPTCRGVTLKTWQTHGYDKTGDGIIDETDLKRIRQEEVVKYILRPHYWNRWRADEINSQAIANILVDWVWGSGEYGITFPQGILGVAMDGIVGPETLAAVNHFPDQEALFEKIKQTRRAFFNMICIDRPANKRFLKGWLNRLNSFKWIPVLLCFGLFPGCKTADKTVKNRMETSTQMKMEMGTTEKIEQEIKQWENIRLDTDEKITVETIRYFLDTPRASPGAEPSVAQITVARMVREKRTNGSRQTELQIKGTEDTRTEMAVSAAGHMEKQEVNIEKSRYKKWMGWAIGVLVLIIGASVYVRVK
jgi:hypothetical protein